MNKEKKGAEKKLVRNELEAPTHITEISSREPKFGVPFEAADRRMRKCFMPSAFNILRKSHLSNFCYLIA